MSIGVVEEREGRSSIRTDLKDGTVGGFRQREGSTGGAFEGECHFGLLGLAGFVGGGRVESGGEEEEERGDCESFHFGCLVGL